MAIPIHELEKMNTSLEAGKTYSEITRSYPKYDYWEIFNEVSVFSLLGKKRMISNRLKKLKNCKTKKDRESLINEIARFLGVPSGGSSERSQSDTGNHSLPSGYWQQR